MVLLVRDLGLCNNKKRVINVKKNLEKLEMLEAPSVLTGDVDVGREEGVLAQPDVSVDGEPGEKKIGHSSFFSSVSKVPN